MSMNKYMHPRNIYKTPPDFKQLALTYPEFRKHVKQDLVGKVSLDFKDVNALRALSRVLLLKDFDLNVEIPENKLIPTIPLRLNYLLWIEDLLNIHGKTGQEIYGIDIGTGASCVYPLIAAKKFNWNMVATEIDEKSAEYAIKNVRNNFLESKIEIVRVKPETETLLEDILIESNKVYDFCMCNPPFFSSTQELHPFLKSRKGKRPHPKNAFCASVNEVVSNGGEVEFVSKLIRESVKFKENITIFTTMIGHKTSLIPLKQLLREVEVNSFKQTEFCQGHTTRWGLAWNFQNIDLRSAPEISKTKVKSKPPLCYILPDLNEIEIAEKSLVDLIQKLELEIGEQRRKKENVIYFLTARSNTWSNQRRKRREKLKETQDSGNSSLQSDDNEKEEKNELLKLAEMEISSSTTPKREYEDEDEYYDNKRIRKDFNSSSCTYLAKFCLSIKKNEDESVILEMFTLDVNTNREILHQILQFIKNNIK